MTLPEKRYIVSVVHKAYSVREICETLGFNRSCFYYHPEDAPSEAVLVAEIEKLAGRYPRYGYRRITESLVRQGYSVGTRRVARLRKKFTSMALKASPRREIASVILSQMSIIRNVHIRR